MSKIEKSIIVTQTATYMDGFYLVSNPFKAHLLHRKDIDEEVFIHNNDIIYDELQLCVSLEPTLININQVIQDVTSYTDMLDDDHYIFKTDNHYFYSTKIEIDTSSVLIEQRDWRSTSSRGWILTNDQCIVLDNFESDIKHLLRLADDVKVRVASPFEIFQPKWIQTIDLCMYVIGFTDDGDYVYCKWQSLVILPMFFNDKNIKDHLELYILIDTEKRKIYTSLSEAHIKQIHRKCTLFKFDSIEEKNQLIETSKMMGKYSDYTVNKQRLLMALFLNRF